MIKAISDNTASISKDDYWLNYYLRKGHSELKALCLCLEKIKWYYHESEILDYRELKTVYHIYTC